MISDEALMAFVAWCRMNHWRYTNDPVLVRRVFDAYALVPDLQDISKDEQDLALLREKIAEKVRTR